MSVPAEISYDLVMDQEMSFVEGTYRLQDSVWEVFIFSRNDVAEPQIKRGRWDSGVTGILVSFPRRTPLNAAAVEQVLATALGVNDWTVVRGPDSIQLR